MNKLQQAAVGALTVVAVGAFMVSQNTRVVHATGSAVAVQVTGTASTEDVNNPAYQPVQFTLLPAITGATINHAQQALYFPVPAGKRLVIDYYSAQAQDLSGPALMTIGTTVNGQFSSYIVYVNKTDTNAVNQKVSICADSGASAVQVFVANGGTATSAAGLITISGHYVNVP